MKRICLVFGLYVAVLAGTMSDELKGKVTLSGSILDTPCAIAMDSIDQSIDLGIVPVSVLKQWGQSPRHSFYVHLIGCRLASSANDTRQTFSITFEGPSDNTGFLVYGQASGVSLVLEDYDGNRILPGIPLHEGAIVAGKRTLEYGLRMANNPRQYRPGSFQTTLRFKLDYY